jgi:hypothetical protein
MDKNKENCLVSVGIEYADDENVTTRLNFNDYDSIFDEMKIVGLVNAPKSFERLKENTSFMKLNGTFVQY